MIASVGNFRPEVFMLEHYYVKPSTIDRIRNSWLGSQMDDYVGWMEANGYSSRTVFRRLPPLFSFAEFAQRRGCIDVTSALSLVDEFVSEWLVQRGAQAKTSASMRKHAIDIGNAARQMLRLASGRPVRHNRHRRPFPLESEVPGFEEYLRRECGLMESTIHGYRHHLHEFAQYLRGAGITSLGDLSPALLASFIVECAPGMAPCTRRDLCCHLKVLLRFCHREGITDRDLRGAVGMPQVYRLADVPRSITWDEVRRTLEAVDRRTIRGRRDYAILLFLVTYGLRAHEVAKLTLEDIDWKRERFQVPERKAGHATAYPLAGVVAEALIDYLKRGRPETEVSAPDGTGTLSKRFSLEYQSRLAHKSGHRSTFSIAHHMRFRISSRRSSRIILRVVSLHFLQPLHFSYSGFQATLPLSGCPSPSSSLAFCCLGLCSCLLIHLLNLFSCKRQMRFKLLLTPKSISTRVSLDLGAIQRKPLHRDKSLGTQHTQHLNK